MANLAWWLGAAAALAACSGTNPNGEFGRVSEPLKMAIGEEFDLGSPYSVLGENGDRPAMACGSTECVVAYLDDLGDWEAPGQLMAARIAPDGSVLDIPALHLAANIEAGQLAIGGDGAGGYLVTWRDITLLLEDRTATPDVRAVHLNAADQTVQDLGVIFSGGYSRPGIYSDGGSFLLTYTSGDEQRYRLVKGGVAGAERTLSFPVSDAAHAPGQYFVVGDRLAQRIDSSTGEPIDASPIVLTKYGEPSPVADTHAASVNGTYVVAWSDYSDIVTVRVRASDGAVLDPDDDFNEFSGAHDVCDDCTSGERLGVVEGVAAKGPEAIVSYSYEPYYGSSRSAVAALRIDPASGQLADSTQYALCSYYPLEDHAFALNGSLGGCVDRSQAQTLTYDEAPFGLSVSPSTLYSSTAGVDSCPAAASNGVDFAVVWQFCPNSGSCSIKATRVAGATGAVLDEPPLEIASSGTGTSVVTVAGHPGGYVIGWSENSIDDIFWACSLSNAGVVGVPLQIGGAPPAEVHSVCNSDQCAISWQVTTALWVERTDVAVTQTDSSAYKSDIARGFALAGDTEPEPAFRTFMSFWNASGTVTGTRLRSTTGAELDDTTIATEAATDSPVFAVSDGSRMMAAWLNGEGSLNATDVDPVSGEPFETLPHELGSPPANTTLRRMWYDGVSYAMLFSSTEEIAVARFGKDFTLLDGSSVADATTVAVDLKGGPDAAASAAGRSLLVYATDQYAPVGRRVRARFLANDGLQAPPTPAEGGQGGQSGDGTLGGQAGDGSDDGLAGALGGGSPSALGGNTPVEQTDGGSRSGLAGAGSPGALAGGGSPSAQAGAPPIGLAGNTQLEQADGGQDGLAAGGSPAGQAGESSRVVAAGGGGGLGNTSPELEAPAGTSQGDHSTSAGSGAVESTAADRDSAGAGTTSAEGGGDSIGIDRKTGAADDDGGCGCRVPSRGNSGRVSALVLLLGVALSRQMRRPSKRSCRGCGLRSGCPAGQRSD